MHEKRTPDGGRRKRMSNSTLFLSGLSRSLMCLNAESCDLNIPSTPDTSLFLVTLMLQSFPVCMRTLSYSLEKVIEKLRLRNFQGSQASSFDFSTLYTSLPHDLIKAKVLSLDNWCFNRESPVRTSDKAGFFSNKKYNSYKCWTCAELCEASTFLMENIYVQFEGMVYQQIVGIPMGTNS